MANETAANPATSPALASPRKPRVGDRVILPTDYGNAAGTIRFIDKPRDQGIVTVEMEQSSPEYMEKARGNNLAGQIFGKVKYDPTCKDGWHFPEDEPAVAQ